MRYCPPQALSPCVHIRGENAGKDRSGLQVVLIRVTESGDQQAVPLNHDRTLIGRLDDCQIRIPVGGVSRKHCEIVVQDGSIVVRDLGSSNGTFVNQDRVSEQLLGPGDLISVGGMVFVVSVNGEPSDIDAAMMYEDGLPETESIAPVAPASKVATKVSTPVSKAPQAVSAAGQNEDSSMMDFNFDFDDDDDQPPL